MEKVFPFKLRCHAHPDRQECLSYMETVTPAFTAVASADAPIATDENAGVHFQTVASVESVLSYLLNYCVAAVVSGVFLP